MNIILEGFDGTGKSTLAQHIHKEFGCRIDHHRGRPTDREHFLRRLRSSRYYHTMRQSVVFDRFPAISENVYRDCGGFAFDNILWEIQKCKIDVIVHCTGSLLTIQPEHDGTQRDRDDTQRLMLSAHEYLMIYDVVMSDLANYIPIIRYDKSIDGDLDRVINYIRSINAPNHC